MKDTNSNCQWQSPEEKDSIKKGDLFIVEDNEHPLADQKKLALFQDIEKVDWEAVKRFMIISKGETR